MPTEIRQVAVIGSGVMGSQIAAQVANAGVPVLLLDIVPKDAADRNVLAKKAIERLMKEPSAFMHPDVAKLVIPGNIDDDLAKIKECDWVLEAVLENPQIKSGIYQKIDSVRRPGTIVSSNTSTIPLAKLIGDQSPEFAKDFMITHFFNPVRHMALLELITGPKTDPQSVELMRGFCDRALGKGVVPCNDTPGFIANRLGMFWLQSAVNAAMDLGLTVEEADEVCGRQMGIPRTGVFGLIDLIGLDLMPLIGKSLLSTLPLSDTYRRIYQEPELFQRMIADGYTGRKGKGGYYRFSKTETGEKVKESINLETGGYAASVVPKIPTLEAAGKDLRVLCEATDKIGQFAWRVLSETLIYAFELVPATVPDVTFVDAGMKLGYNWKFGPFELLDKLGADWIIARLKAEARPVPAFLQKASGKSFYRVALGQNEVLQLDGSYAPIKRAQGVLLLSDIKLSSKPVEKNGSAALWDIGDGVMCLELLTKANVLDHHVFTMIHRAVALIGDGSCAWKGLVIYNESGNFSAGAPLDALRDLIKAGDFGAIETFIKHGQIAFTALRYAGFPSVAAAVGVTLDGGAELTLHCSAVQAYCECEIGFVGLGVGLIPAWGGCAQMLRRVFNDAENPIPPVNRLFELMTSARVSKSAADAKSLGFLLKTDGITMNHDRLMYDAKLRVLEMAQAGYKAPQPWSIDLPGPSGKASLELVLESSKLSPHDITIAKLLAAVLCGDEAGLSEAVTESRLMEAECEACLKLCKMPENLARIEHRIEKGKALKT